VPDPELRLFEVSDDPSEVSNPRPTPPRKRSATAAPSILPDDGQLVVTVLPDVPAIAKTFDYVVPEHLRDHVRVGTVVRIELAGRRVQGWIVAMGGSAPSGTALRPIPKITGWGPPPDVLELTAWGAWRWAGRRTALLRTATADHAVPTLPSSARERGSSGPRSSVVHADAVALAFAEPGVAVVRCAPGVDTFEFAAAAASRAADGRASLILAPSIDAARHLGIRLRRAGLDVATLPADWASVRGGASAVGSRAAAWAPIEQLASVVVLDEHDEVYQEERTPTWHARDVSIERAARAGVPCVLVSPIPSLDALRRADRLIEPSRVAERAGWPLVDVIDLRAEDPLRAGIVSSRLAGYIHEGRRVVCVLNRKGRAQQLACNRCDTLARCERCEAAVALVGDARELLCKRCGEVRPMVCVACGATRLKQLRLGVARLRDDIARNAIGPVVEVSSDTAGHETASHATAGRDTASDDAQVLVGTEAVLHQVRGKVEVVAFLDLDQELSAPRYRAAEQALALLVRGARLLGGRAAGGRLLLQTRLADHEVVQAAVHADPRRVVRVDEGRRAMLQFPPFVAMAAISGAVAEQFVAGIDPDGGLQVVGPADGVWLVRAETHSALSDGLAAVTRPAGRLRIEVDPLRV